MKKPANLRRKSPKQERSMALVEAIIEAAIRILGAVEQQFGAILSLQGEVKRTI